MRKFNICFGHKNKIIAYLNLEGEKATKLMKNLENKGFNCWAITKTFESENKSFIEETLTLKEMEAIYDPE